VSLQTVAPLTRKSPFNPTVVAPRGWLTHRWNATSMHSAPGRSARRDVVIKGWEASWTYGGFKPAEGFAPGYGGWSLLMHEHGHRPLDPAAAKALREAERRMDRIHARVYCPDYDAWHDVAQLNIDGGVDRVERSLSGGAGGSESQICDFRSQN
jgi:hypothetical protein